MVSSVNHSLVQIDGPFHLTKDEHAYDTHIYVQKKHFSGVLLFKYVDGLYRFSMLTKTGARLIDMSTDGDRLIKHAILPELDKKIILEQLKQDFYLLILSCEGQSISSEKTVLHDCRDTRKFIHAIQDADGHVAQIGIGSRKRLRSWADFSEYQRGIPARITIDHRSLINLRLELTAVPLERTK